MLRIRLQRSGRRNRPHFRVVLAEHASPVKGKSIRHLGTYDPLIKGGFDQALKVDSEQIMAWIGKGARPTSTVARLMKGIGIAGMEPFIIEMKSKAIKNPKKQPVAAAPAEVSTEAA